MQITHKVSFPDSIENFDSKPKNSEAPKSAIKAPLYLSQAQRLYLLQDWRQWVNSSAPDHRRQQVLGKLEEWLEKNDASHPLNLPYCGLTSVPPLPEGIQHLDLTGNELSHLPEQFPESLIVLRLTENRLTRFAAALGSCIEELYIDNNQLTLFPSSLPANLKILWLQQNKLLLLPGISFPDRFPNLQEFCVNSNRISHLPPRINNALEVLDASDNPLVRYPVSWGSHLRKVTLPIVQGKDNHPVNLPQHLKQNLSSNSVEFLDSSLHVPVSGKTGQQNKVLKPVLKKPMSASELHSLQTKDIETTADNSLGLSVQQKSALLHTWQNWAYTDVSEPLRTHVYNILDTWLEKNDASLSLELPYCGLISVPALPDRTRHLNLAGNQFHIFPKQWPRQLISLDMSSNKLTEFTGQFGPFLAELYLHNNRLNQVPERLPVNLNTLWLQNNRLKSLPGNSFPQMKRLRADNNQIQNMPKNMYPALESLDLTGNPIKKLPVNWGQQLQTLKIPRGLGPQNRPLNLPDYLVVNQSSTQVACGHLKSIEFIGLSRNISSPPNHEEAQQETSVLQNLISVFRRTD